MKNTIKIILVVCLASLAFRGYCQQAPLFNASIIDPVIENPALVGNYNYSNVFLDYRKQWVEIEGAPESALITVDWPMKDEKSGLGIIVSSDRTNILGHTGILTAYSHNIKLGTDQNLRLGLALNLNHNTLFFDKVEAINPLESTLFNYSVSASGLNANFGAAYHLKGLNAGLSAVNLVNSRIQYTDETNKKKLQFQYIPQYLINVNYTFEFAGDFSVRPEIALRDLQGMPAQFEANFLAGYDKKYYIGAFYRNNNSVGMLASALIYERLSVTYSCQTALGKLSGYSGSTHEITIGYRFYTSHFQDYKPADKQKVDKLLEYAQKQNQDNNDLKKSNDELRKQQDDLKQELKKEKEEISRLKETMEQERENNDQARAEDGTPFDNVTDEDIKDPTEPIYIILGVFSDIYSAKDYQQVLRREYGLGTEVLKRKNKQDFIVCVNKTFQSRADLQKELTRLRKITGNYTSSDVWIYVKDK